MYTSNIALFFFGITVLITISYQYVPELEPEPSPRDPPDQARHYDVRKSIKNFTWWACASRPILYMRWPDRLYRPNQSDLWFDRLVYIHHEGNYDYIMKSYIDFDTGRLDTSKEIAELSFTLNGIIFDDDRILTSYNPFRQIIKYAFKRQFTHVCVLDQRKIDDVNDDGSTRFLTTPYSISCARQVVPLHDYDLPPNMWHGKASGDFMRQHSPLHDLMVIRIAGFIKGMTKSNYDFEFFKKQQEYYKHGPQKTYLAKKDDVMGREFKFAMMGHIFARHLAKKELSSIKNQDSFAYKQEAKYMRDTYVGYFNQSDNVLIDCDKWIPREWGLFICVLNKHGLRRLASGAALYSRGLLFGIGSFTLYKGDESILVFTDIRPYESLITNNETGPCTTKDQFGKTHAKRRGNNMI